MFFAKSQLFQRIIEKPNCQDRTHTGTQNGSPLEEAKIGVPYRNLCFLQNHNFFKKSSKKLIVITGRILPAKMGVPWRGPKLAYPIGIYVFCTRLKRSRHRLPVRRRCRLATPYASREGYYGVSRGANSLKLLLFIIIIIIIKGVALG